MTRAQVAPPEAAIGETLDAPTARAGSAPLNRNRQRRTAPPAAKPFVFTDRNGARVEADSAAALRRAVDAAGLRMADSNIVYRGTVDPEPGVIDAVMAAFKGTGALWFFHRPDCGPEKAC